MAQTDVTENNDVIFRFDDILKKALIADIKVGNTPFLVGPAGIGKSSYLESLAKELGTKVFTLTCNQLAYKDDLSGVRAMHDEKTGKWTQVFFPHASIAACIEYAKANPRETPIMFLDEVNRSSSDITSAVLSFTTARVIGTEKIPDNVRFVVAGNDKGNVTTLDSASIRRFVVYHVAPDTATYLGLNQNLNPHIKAVLEKYPDDIMCETNVMAGQDDDDDTAVYTDFDPDSDDFLQGTVPRTLTYLSNWMNEVGDAALKQYLANGVLQGLIAAHVGNTVFTAHLIEEIQTSMVSVAASTKAVTVPKPAVYDSLKACTTVDDLDDMIQNQLTDKERSGCLLYALHEAADNGVIIKELSDNTTQFDQDDLAIMIDAMRVSELDRANVDTFVGLNTTISNSVSAVLMVMR